MPIAVNPNVHISGDLYVTLDNEEVIVKGSVAVGQPTSDAPVLVGAETPGNTVISIQADATGNLFTDMIDRAGRLVGIVDTELPAAAVLGDADGNPTTPLIGACQMGWDAVGVHWERMLVVAGALVVDTELDVEDFDTGVGTDDQAILGLVYPGAGGHVTVTATVGLPVDVLDRAARDLGKVDITAFDTAITAADATVTPTTSPPVVAINMLHNVGGTWDMQREGNVAGSILSDVTDRAARLVGIVDTELVTHDLDTTGASDMQAAVGLLIESATGALVVGATNPLPIAGTVDVTELPAAVALTDAFANPTVTQIGAFLMGYDGPAGTWERVHVTPGTGHLDVAIQSSVGLTVTADTELPVAAALQDAAANPTTPMVGANQMVWHPTGTDWDRAISAEEGDGVLTGLPAVGGFVWNGGSWDMIHEGSVAGSVLVDTELPVAAALTDAFANPTVPGIGAFLMGFDSVAGDWERVQIAPGTGHLDVAIQSSVGLAVTADTELPVAGALSDAMVNPTTPLIGSIGLILNGAGTYDRVREGYAPGSISVDPYYEPVRAIGTSAGGGAQVVSTATEPCKILFVTCKWSAAVTKDVAMTLNAGAGLAYDTILGVMAFVNETDGVWFPDSEIVIKNDDQLDVSAPAAGGAITSSIMIYTQPVAV